VRRMAQSSLVDMAWRLLQDLAVRRGNRPVLLPQLGRTTERIRCYRRRCASVTGSSRTAIVHLVSWHLRGTLLLGVGLIRLALVGIGGIWHRNGTRRLNDWR
jgi:hypothetical protein